MQCFAKFYGLFEAVANDICLLVQRSATPFRPPILIEKRLTAFLMAASSCTYRRIAKQLAMGPSSVLESVRSVSYAIELRLPSSIPDVAALMNGFEDISGLPYCVGAIDGSHIPWKKCPSAKYYEYRCYKGFESMILFSLVSSDRTIIYADVGSPGILSDSTLFDRSKLRCIMESGTWPSSGTPPLKIGYIVVRPYTFEA